MAEYDDQQWAPPTEAEKKIFAARRERQDKISKAMGEYLLKGYKMLATECQVCGTILLRDKQQRDYCVACSELDSDSDKDNPALHTRAALAQVRENDIARNVHTASGADPVGSGSVRQILQPRNDPRLGAGDTTRSSDVAGDSLTNCVNVRQTVITNLNAKMMWASQELNGTTCVETAVRLCELIKHCCEALKSVQSLKQ